MKKKLQIGLILGMIILGNSAFAQTNESAKTYLDVLVNLVGTNLNYGDANSQVKDYKKSILGGQLGVSFQAGITPAFSIVPEFYFTMKGGKLKVNNPLTIEESTIRLYAVELPVLARFHFSNIHINAGPSIAYNFYGTQSIGDQSPDFAYKHFDAGIQVGGGYTFHTKTRRIALDLRYNCGLTNFTYGHEAYNRSFVVSAHFSAPWKTNPFGKN